MKKLSTAVKVVLGVGALATAATAAVVAKKKLNPEYIDDFDDLFDDDIFDDDEDVNETEEKVEA